MQELPPEQPNEEISQVGNRDKPVCYHCGYKGHLASTCKYRSTKCNGAKDAKSKGQHRGMDLVEAEDDLGDSDSSGDLHSIFQLGNQSQEKVLVTVNVNGVPIDVEVDPGAEHSTIPTPIFNEKLARVYPTFIVVDITGKLPLLGRDWLQKLGINLTVSIVSLQPFS